jgi:hypothetical protein
MGYTKHTIDLVEELIIKFSPGKVIDLGAQNNYAQPNLPAPYMSDWYKEKGIEYLAIDINRENGAIPMDLSKKQTMGDVKPIYEKFGTYQCDMLVDAGTSEHVSGPNGKHSITAIYNCWKTKHDLLKPGGIMLNENPKTGHWPGHGCNYYTQDFYHKLAELQGYDIIYMEENAAMGNVTDGWNITCILIKPEAPFISIEEFITCGILTK